MLPGRLKSITTRTSTIGSTVLPKEDQEQTALAYYLDMKGVWWCHVPNGGMRNEVVAAKLKAQGVKAGVPDCLIFTPPPNRPEVRGVAIELKRQKGAPSNVSDNQKRWLGKLQDNGWLTFVAYGASDAINWLIEVCGF